LQSWTIICRSSAIIRKNPTVVIHWIRSSWLHPVSPPRACVCGTSGKLDEFSRQLQSCNLDIVSNRTSCTWTFFFGKPVRLSRPASDQEALDLSGQFSLRASYRHSNEGFFRLLKTTF
jgi:hypothetical protein